MRHGPRAGPRALAASLCLGLLLTATASARSAESVAVVVAGSDAEVQRLGSHLRPLLSRLGLGLVLERVATVDADTALASTAPAPGQRARVWVDLRDRRQAQVVFAGAGTGRPVARVVPLAARGGDDVAAAEIGEIVVAALGAKDELSADTSTPRRASAMDQPAGASVWSWSPGLAGALESWSSDEPAVGSVAASLLALRRSPQERWTLGIWSLARYRPAFVTAARPVGARVRGGAVDLLLHAGHALGDRAAFGLAAGLGADLRIADPSIADGATLEQPRQQRDFVLLLRTAARFELAVGPRLALFAVATLDLVPRQGRFVVLEADGGRASILRPWPLRPGALLGVSWALGAR